MREAELAQGQAGECLLLGGLLHAGGSERAAGPVPARLGAQLSAGTKCLAFRHTQAGCGLAQAAQPVSWAQCVSSVKWEKQQLVYLCWIGGCVRTNRGSY